MTTVMVVIVEHFYFLLVNEKSAKMHAPPACTSDCR